VSDSVRVPSFEDFVSSHRRKLAYYASRFRLEREEVENSAYLAWSEAVKKFRVGHPSRASFETFTFSTLENMLQADAGSLITIAESDLGSHEVEEVALEGIRYFEIVTNRFAAANTIPVEEQLEELLTRSYADIAFQDVIRAHPVYGNPTYRRVIDGLLAKAPVETIAKNGGYTPRRVYQALAEIVHIIQRRDPVLDNRLIHLEGDEALEAEPVHYRPIDSLHFDVPDDLDRARVLEIARSMLDQGQMQPVLIDQFHRVVKGVKRMVAAKIIQFRYVKTLTRPVAEGVDSRSPEAHARLRAIARMEEPEPLQLIPILLRQLGEGMLSLLVATRLAALSLQAQYLLITHLPATLVPLLSIRDANALVRAHEYGSLRKEAARLRDGFCKKLVSL